MSYFDAEERKLIRNATLLGLIALITLTYFGVIGEDLFGGERTIEGIKGHMIEELQDVTDSRPDIIPNETESFEEFEEIENITSSITPNRLKNIKEIKGIAKLSEDLYSKINIELERVLK